MTDFEPTTEAEWYDLRAFGPVEAERRRNGRLVRADEVVIGQCVILPRRRRPGIVECLSAASEAPHDVTVTLEGGKPVVMAADTAVTVTEAP